MAMNNQFWELLGAPLATTTVFEVLSDRLIVIKDGGFHVTSPPFPPTQLLMVAWSGYLASPYLASPPLPHPNLYNSRIHHCKHVT